MAYFFIFIFDDKLTYALEFADLIAKLYSNTIQINGREYRIKIIFGHNFDDCKAILRDPENLRRGGLVLLDLAFDDNNPQNRNLFSLRMLRELKQEMRVDVLPYAIAMMTAFDEEIYKYIFEEDDCIRIEKIGQIYKKNAKGETVETQLKEVVLKFENQYLDIDGVWKRFPEAHKKWLQNYEMRITVGAYNERQIEHLRNVYHVDNIRRPAKNYWMANEIFAIERIALEGYPFYIVYPASPNQHPFYATRIELKGSSFEGSTGIWNEYNPSTTPKFDALIQKGEFEPLHFVRTHNNFMISLVYFQSIQVDLPPRFLPLQSFTLYQWVIGQNETMHSHRGGFAELRNGDYSMYFPISGGHDPNRGINTLQCQRELLNHSNRYTSWYEKTRIV